MGREHLPRSWTGSRIRRDGAEGSPKQLSLSPRLEKGHEGERQEGCTESGQASAFLLSPGAQMDFSNLCLRPCHRFPTGSGRLGAEPRPVRPMFPATL